MIVYNHEAIIKKIWVIEAIVEQTRQNAGPVYTSAFSFETAYISMRLGLLSTLRRWTFSAKPH